MAEEIVNRVANSGLKTFDLGQYYPKEKLISLDIKPWLFQGLLLKEKDFRAALQSHDWSEYQDQMVYVHCSTDAIIPQWAFMLIATYLDGKAKCFVTGDKPLLIYTAYLQAFDQIDFSQFQDERIIMKGCGFAETPSAVFMAATQRLKPYVKSIMFGEPCSTVPVYKRPKSIKHHS